eukprot:1132650-Rhodomonas_salina.4
MLLLFDGGLDKAEKCLSELRRHLKTGGFVIPVLTPEYAVPRGDLARWWPGLAALARRALVYDATQCSRGQRRRILG